MGRKMGLDVGSKRIGVAVSDKLNFTAQGHTVLERDREFNELEEIATIVKKHEIDEVIVGIPRSLDGTLGKQACEVEVYVEKLNEVLDVPITGWDERLTTSVAEKSLIRGGKKRKSRKKIVDKVASVIILQTYLDSLRNQKL